jgi:hypothetical protein
MGDGCSFSARKLVPSRTPDSADDHGERDTAGRDRGCHLVPAHAFFALRHGETSWTASMIPLSVDGMIVASSMSLLLDSGSGRRGGALPWCLLVVGSLASLAANVAVAESTLIGRTIAAWPSLALCASFEMLMRQMRQSVTARSMFEEIQAPKGPGATNESDGQPEHGFAVDAMPARGLQRQAWRWALDHLDDHGELPSGEAIAQEFGRSPRWGRFVKRSGKARELTATR